MNIGEGNAVNVLGRELAGQANPVTQRPYTTEQVQVALDLLLKGAYKALMAGSQPGGLTVQPRAVSLNAEQRDVVRHFQSYNVPAQWFTGAEQDDGTVEVIALGENFCWSFLIASDGTFASSEAKLGEFSTGIDI